MSCHVPLPSDSLAVCSTRPEMVLDTLRIRVIIGVTDVHGRCAAKCGHSHTLPIPDTYPTAEVYVSKLVKEDFALTAQQLDPACMLTLSCYHECANEVGSPVLLHPTAKDSVVISCAPSLGQQGTYENEVLAATTNQVTLLETHMGPNTQFYAMESLLTIYKQTLVSSLTTA